MTAQGRNRPGHPLRAALRESPLRPVVVSLRHRGLAADDFFVASYPRSGNTWLRFVLADLLNDGPVDFEQVEEIIPAVGAHRRAKPVGTRGGRLIKTHEPHRRAYSRGVYLVRDVRDVLVSQYRVYREDPNDLSEFDEFVARFSTPAGSLFGSWTAHVRSWRDAVEAVPALRMYRFEDLRLDPVAGIGEIAVSAGLDVTPERIQAALDRNTAADMRRKEQENLDFLESRFGRLSTGVREGISGRWTELLSARHLAQLDTELGLNRELGYDD